MNQETKAREFSWSQIRFLDKLCISKQDQNYNFIRTLANKIPLDSKNIETLKIELKSGRKLSMSRPVSSKKAIKRNLSISSGISKYLRPNSAIKEKRIKNLLDNQEYSKSSVKLHGLDQDQELNADLISS
jgi:hypothetical protein